MGVTCSELDFQIGLALHAFNRYFVRLVQTVDDGECDYYAMHAQVLADVQSVHCVHTVSNSFSRIPMPYSLCTRV